MIVGVRLSIRSHI